ncbi:thiosulfate sulfurtransferase [Thelephora ganbajun]|uniref:Thiosulfate sulfurtransferase n=1 Tax=Thelephora ganbajun TaxID=370292 RepID=A0ACB6Z296_THEGA|nr:thiosulfate sulfurtransferase [Thelephora ganbajun]
MIKVMLPNRCRFATRSFLNVTVSTRSFSSQDVAPLLVNPSNVTKDAVSIDASWHMPNSPRKAREEFLNKRLPQARFLDLDEVAKDHQLRLKHMIPDPQVFAKFCERSGISRTSPVVLYDTHGVFSSPRALFMFRAFGHTNSSVLNSGLPAWESTLNPVQYSPPSLDGSVIRGYEQIVSNSSKFDSTSELVLDARAHGRFLGTDPEPRPGLPSGHVPNSFSLPFNLFLAQNTNIVSGETYTRFKTRDEILEELKKAVGDGETRAMLEGKRQVVTSCGSGMTAGVLWLGLDLLGVKGVALYDESWTGYAMRPQNKIAKGE